MSTLLQDVRHALRLLKRSPGFTASALLVLALGIGTTVAMVGIVRASLLASMPYADSERMVLVWSTDPKNGFVRDQVSATDVYDYRRLNHVFEDIATFTDWRPALSGSGEPKRLYATQVGDGFFRVLGATPLLGRTFLPEDQEDGKDFVVVLSYGFWQRQFAGDPGVIGKNITLSARSYTIVGVMPRSFASLPNTLVDGTAELYRPVAEKYDNTQRTSRHLRAIARLKPGVDLAQAQADMEAIAAQLGREYPRDSSYIGVRLVPLRQDTSGPLRMPVLAVFGAVLMVLLMATANIANLLLVRSAARRTEIAIRAALGARTSRIVRQLLTESLLLSLMGAALGSLLALWITRSVQAVGGGINTRLADIPFDSQILGFTVLLAIAVGVIFGLAPARRLTSGKLYEGLKTAGRSTFDRNRLGRTVVMLEISTALLLLVSAGLLLKSLWRLQQVEPGFATANRVSMKLWLPYARYNKDEAVRRFFQQAQLRLNSLPGVVESAFVSTLPFTTFDRRGFQIEGRQYRTGEFEDADAYVITPGYLHTLSIPLLRGRDFDERDAADRELVVIVNRTAAGRLWPGRDPIGTQIHFAGDDKVRTIVGIVGDVRHYSLDREPSVQVYIPHQQFPMPTMTLVVHARGDPAALVPAVRSEVAALDKELPLFDIATMEDLVADSVLLRRILMYVVLGFALMGLLLGVIGLYGVVSFMVAQRTREIGIRVALGAGFTDIVRLVLREAMSLAIIGLLAGTALSLLAARLLQSQLFGITAWDPGTFISVALLLGAIALTATYVPARRAARVDPMVALRSE